MLVFHHDKKHLFFLFYIFLFITGCQTNKQIPQTSPASPIPLSQRIETLINNYDPHAKIGIQIVSLQSNKTIYEHNPFQLFIPASILKLYTAAAALHYLGPSYRFETQVFVEDLDKNKIGNLYIRANGDPSFSMNDIVKIANTLKQLHIKTIQGNIIIDDNQFDNILWGNGWMWNDMINGYSALISAMNVDNNRIAVFAWPQKNVKDPVSVTLEPYTSFVKLQVSAQTASEKSPGSVQFSLSAPDQKDARGENSVRGIKKGQTIYISGSLPKNKTYQYETFSIENPSLFAGFLLKEQLEKNKIQVKGQIEQGETSNTARLIDTISSRPLSESLIDFVKFSNNQATETLLKAIGLKTGDAPGTFAKGTKAVWQFLNQEVQIKTKGLVNADGSGLSRYSLTSPAQMTHLLSYMWNNFAIGPEFVATLPIAGKDGTLNRGWQSSSLKGSLRAKTGTMSNVCSLAGYLNAGGSETYAFTFMINGSVLNGAECRNLMDQILMETLKA